MIDLTKLAAEGTVETPRMRAGEYHRVTCPYCAVGYTDVLVTRSAGQAQLEGMNDPKKCVTCGRYFKLKAQFRIVGVPHDDRVEAKR